MLKDKKGRKFKENVHLAHQIMQLQQNFRFHRSNSLTPGLFQFPCLSFFVSDLPLHFRLSKEGSREDKSKSAYTADATAEHEQQQEKRTDAQTEEPTKWVGNVVEVVDVNVWGVDMCMRCCGCVWMCDCVEDVCVCVCG